MGEITIRFYKKEDGENKLFTIKSYTMLYRIIDIKKEIIQDFFDKKKDYLDIVNISPRVFKDFGKVHMSLGDVPRTFDFYSLSDISNPDRTFEFLVVPVSLDTVEHIQEHSNEKFVVPEPAYNNYHSYDNYSGNRDNRRPVGRIYTNSRYKQEEQQQQKKEYSYNDSDFPSL